MGGCAGPATGVLFLVTVVIGEVDAAVPFGTWPVPFGMLFSKVFKQRQLVNSMVRNPEETRLVFSSILHWFGSHEISRRGRIRVGRRPQPFQTKALNVEQSPQPMSILGWKSYNLKRCTVNILAAKHNQ